MALSDWVVRQAKATGKDYTLHDSDGLSLAVTATGSKSWHFRYYWMKEPKRMSLGAYPEVTLREAHALRDETRALVAKDINPRLHRKQKRAAVKLAGENTFEAIDKKWLAHRELGLKEGRQTTLSIRPRVFAKDVLKLAFNLVDTMSSDRFAVTLENAVMVSDLGQSIAGAPTLSAPKPVLVDVLFGDVSLDAMVSLDEARLDGDAH